MELLSHNITCPYCGESIELLIDDSVAEHMSIDGQYQSNMGAVVEDYYEDCSVCCRPIRVQQNIGFDGECVVVILRDDE